jgi:hypothetical protein
MMKPSRVRLTNAAKELDPEHRRSALSVPQIVSERFGCPEDLIADFVLSGDLSQRSGFFRWGADIVCYGQCSSGVPANGVTEVLHDACEQIRLNGPSVHLSFDPAQVVNNLRFERYPVKQAGASRSVSGQGAVRSLYYRVRPFLPVSVRKHFQRLYFRDWEKIPFPQWPLDLTVDNIFERLLVASMKLRKVRRLPFIWFWPEGFPSCTIITHDVETQAGVDFCTELMDLNDSFEIKTSFQVVPEDRYPVPEAFLEDIRRRGFEVNVQDLNHDGLLFGDRAEFLRRAERINSYGRKWGALGFRAGILYRNFEWSDALDFSYDMSIPNVAHLDPQRGGCCTVLPFFIGKRLELPVTTTQDYTLFQMLKDYSIRLWKKQISLIREKHGLISMIIHPDYIIAEDPRRVYAELLRYLSELRSQRETWIALPREVDAWWRLRSELTLVKIGNSWRIRGKGSERARLGYAVLHDDHLTYEIEGSVPGPLT